MGTSHQACADKECSQTANGQTESSVSHEGELQLSRNQNSDGVQPVEGSFARSFDGHGHLQEVSALSLHRNLE